MKYAVEITDAAFEATERQFTALIRAASPNSVALLKLFAIPEMPRADAAPGVLARALEVQTSTPGFSAQVYVSDHVDLELPYGDSTPLGARGWQGPVGASTDVRSGEHIALSLAGHPYRYYLVWLTTLPPNMQSATIDELTLFK